MEGRSPRPCGASTSARSVGSAPCRRSSSGTRRSRRWTCSSRRPDGPRPASGPRRAMPTLPELQAGLAAAILHEDARPVAALIAPDGLSPAARVQVYSHHGLASLAEALEATYPVVSRLVDRRFFAFAADRFIRDQPPAGPCLFEYGAAFPDFLRTFPPCAGHPYLPDVARLEWLM